MVTKRNISSNSNNSADSGLVNKNNNPAEISSVENIIPEKSKKRPEAIGNVPVSPSPVVQMGIDDDGRVVAGFASFDSLQALYSTETTLRSTLKKLNNSNGAVLDIATRSKNFQV